MHNNANHELGPATEVSVDEPRVVGHKTSLNFQYSWYYIAGLEQLSEGNQMGTVENVTEELKSEQEPKPRPPKKVTRWYVQPSPGHSNHVIAELLGEEVTEENLHNTDLDKNKVMWECPQSFITDLHDQADQDDQLFYEVYSRHNDGQLRRQTIHCRTKPDRKRK